MPPDHSRSVLRSPTVSHTSASRSTRQDGQTSRLQETLGQWQRASCTQEGQAYTRHRQFMGLDPLVTTKLAMIP
jgi:hypothetical protein